MKKLLPASVIAAVLSIGAAQAGTIVYGNNASFGADVITAVDISTGQVVQEFNAPVSGNGRGIAVVGTTIYYTNAGSGLIYKTDTVTHADGGIFADTGAGSSGIATVAYDGTNFYATGYSGNNTTKVYDANGTLLRTQSGLGNGRDGFEVANSFIIANRGDAEGPYDKYNLDGTLVSQDFLVDPNTTQTTGVTFDGTDYYVSEIYNNAIAVFDSNGTYLNRVTLSTTGHLLEDLSALGNVPNNPPVTPPDTGVPEPATLALMLGGLAVAGITSRRSRATTAGV